METNMIKEYATREQDKLMQRCGYASRLWTVQELLELLPEFVSADGSLYFFVLRKYYDYDVDVMKYEAAYEDTMGRPIDSCSCESRHVLDALLSLVVSLHDNNIISHEKA